MAPRDASRVQLDFPELTADLIAALRLTGTVGLLDFSDLVRPVFLIGSRGVEFGGANPTFASSQVFHGQVTNPAANTVIADTGALPAGTYDIWGFVEGWFSVALDGAIRIEHRNAANNATLATLLSSSRGGTTQQGQSFLGHSRYTIALNERLRVISPQNVSVQTMAGGVWAALVPTP